MDTTPLIDIVFQLLIFFMLTSAFVYQPGIKVHLPKAVTSELASRETIVVTISGNSSLFLGSRAVTLKELESHLQKSAQSNPSILIRADHQTALGRVVEVWDLCRAVGLRQVNIATSSEKS